MAKAVTIIRADFTATGLRQAAACSNEAKAARRMLGLALVLEGYPRGEAARLCAMDRQTLRDWVIRYNAEGVARLFDRTSPGPKPRLTPEQEAAVAELVRKGPDLAKDGVVRWRRVDLARVIQTRFNVTLAECWRDAAPARVSALVGAAAPSAAGPGSAGDTKKNFADLVKAAIPKHAREQPIELWWQDEARVGQQGTLTRASGPSAAAVQPRRGISAANGPTYLALSALIAISVRPWSCLMLTRKRLGYGCRARQKWDSGQEHAFFTRRRM